MTFTSIVFLYFILISLTLYWVVRRRGVFFQNVILLIFSVVFICLADSKSALVITLSTGINFYFVHALNAIKNEGGKRLLFYFGCALNIFILGYFKYLNDLLAAFSSIYNGDFVLAEKVFLPLGISFFTFQVLGYWIDVYNEDEKPATNVLDFFLFLLYFPKVISGPIERFGSFRSQIKNVREFDYVFFTDGLRQFLWGFFKKSVTSYHCFLIYQELYEGQINISGFNILASGMIYLIYVYTDFSGYSDMACGISKLFGIKITNNFGYPLFARSIGEFWKRWHISLTQWVINYVFSPLSFFLRRRGKIGVFVAMLISFLVVGIWHGLKSGFIVFGCLQALFFLPAIIEGRNSIAYQEGNNGSILDILRMARLFILMSLASLFTREIPAVESMNEILLMFMRISYHPDFHSALSPRFIIYWILLLLFIIIEWNGRKWSYSIENVGGNAPIIIRWSFYTLLIFLIGMYMNTSESPFIYQQF